MRKVLLIGEVALLADDIEFGFLEGQRVPPPPQQSPANKWLFDKYKKEVVIADDANAEDAEDDDEDDEEDAIRKNSDLYEVEGMNEEAETPAEKDDSLKKEKKGPLLKWIHSAKKTREVHNSASVLLNEKDRRAMESLLGEWEEPDIKKKFSVRSRRQHFLCKEGLYDIV